MARLARVVVPGLPHHVTQRGNRRQHPFFGDDEYRAYKALLAGHCAKAGVALWAYCVMPNHVHLIAVPEAADTGASLPEAAAGEFSFAITATAIQLEEEDEEEPAK